MNVERKEQFQQVCVWPGCVVGADDVARFKAWMLDEFGARIQYLEEIETAEDSTGPGGRNDLFFSVHEADISAFAVKRLAFGIRWIEDVLAECNGGLCADGKPVLYPDRVLEYKTW